MTINQELISRFEYSNGSFKATRGKGKGKMVTEGSIAEELIKSGVPYQDISIYIDSIKDKVKVELDSVTQVVTDLGVFDNFYIINNTTHNSSIVFYRANDLNLPVCSLAELGKESIGNSISLYDRELGIRIMNSLRPRLTDKSLDSVSYLDCIDSAITAIEPRLFLPIEKVSQDLHPAVLEGLEVPSLTKIPYTPDSDVTFDSMNQYMKEFLLRVENHEHMLAIIYSSFIGIKHPYALYLLGKGGDSKTSFVKFLGKLTKSFASFDEGGNFNFFSMYGRAIINIPDSKNPKISQSNTFKVITGGSYVKVEGKGKDAYAGEIRGLIIIDSNVTLELLGTPDEERRLRFFKIASANLSIDDQIDQDTYLNLLSENPNEFLNYSRQCYEKLVKKGGMIPAPPNHKEVLSSMRDRVEIAKFNEFLKGRIFPKGYSLGESLSCDNAEILLELSKKWQNDKYIKANFERFLSIDLGIKTENGQYIGIGLTKPRISQDDIRDAMPK